MPKRKPYKTFTKEFKQEAVRLMTESDQPASVIAAITMAVWRRRKPANVIVHSDQGSTYRSKACRDYLDKNHLLCSMSRKGECLDNAVAESFFGTLKTEWVDHLDYRTREPARKSLFEYIEMFYNVRRRHSKLDYVSPAEYEINASN